jgi:uncharacterized protein (TIGR03000 family)
MYSIALLMALSGGTEVADGHHRGGCCGQVATCCGCYGGGHHHHRHHHRGGCCGVEVCCAPVSCGCYGGAGGPGPVPPHAEPLKAAPTEKKTEGPAPASIYVQLPADAILKVDGVATTSTSDLRVLVSPELPLGKDFQYTLTAQVVRDGKPVQVEQNVVVRAGEESHVSLNLPVATVAQR